VRFGDIKNEGLDRETPLVFMPIVQQPRTTVFAVARTREGFHAESLLKSRDLAP
jgi:hypothetical protein